MESRSNSTENHVYPMMHDVAFGIVAVILTIIIISIFFTIYKIGFGEDPSLQIQLEPRIVAPHNTPNDSNMIVYQIDCIPR